MSSITHLIYRTSFYPISRFRSGYLHSYLYRVPFDSLITLALLGCCSRLLSTLR
ncbi:hypothetical protein HanRHA438_Chr13g0585001 [Helianthus annuus]|nr:hypothetical protein HanIR_Chr10g0460101 [Helianthus annuus]KAJ0856999.1 hypothetical protein HanRHA438_Chr13g0585001 [Helianthus annuus]